MKTELETKTEEQLWLKKAPDNSDKRWVSLDSLKARDAEVKEKAKARKKYLENIISNQLGTVSERDVVKGEVDGIDWVLVLLRGEL